MPKNPKDQKGYYKVGYGRPPEHMRFKKGQSGNPSGRPKGKVKVADIDSVLDEVANAPIAVNDNGRARKISKLQALIISEFNKALKGDPRSVKQIVALLSKRGSRTEPESAVQSRTAEETRRDFDLFLDRIAGGSERPPDAKPQNDNSADTDERGTEEEANRQPLRKK